MKLPQAIQTIAHHPAVLLVIRIIVGGIFVAFGVSKALAPKEEFFAAIVEYQMVPDILVPTFGMTVLYAEIIFGLLFILGIFRKWSAIVLSVLLIMFIIAIAQTAVRGIDLQNCGCSSGFKFGETPNDVIIRDAGLLLLMVWYLAVESKTRATAWTLDRLFERRG